MRSRLFALPLASLLSFTAAHAQTTWIVDAANGPGTNFSDLPPAIVAARDGDIVRVRAGTYTWANLSKGLRILGSGSGVTTLEGPGRFDIARTGPTQAIWLEGVRLRPIASDQTPSSSLAIEDTAGPVVLRDVRIQQSGSIVLLPFAPEPPLFLRRCAHVHLTGYSASGSVLRVFPQEFGGSSGIEAEDCFLEMHRCQVRGQDAYSTGTPQPGGTALRFRRGHAVLVDSSFIGGRGDIPCLAGFPPGPGGAGIAASEGAQIYVYGRPSSLPTVWGGASARICSFSVRTGPGGPGIALDASHAHVDGLSPLGGGGNPSGSPAALANGSTYVNDPNALPPMASIVGTPSLGSSVTLRLEAAPSSTAFLVIALEHRYLPLAPAAIGSLLVATTPSVLIGPTTLAGTTWDLPIDLVAGWPVDLPILAQFLVLEPSRVYASNATALLVLSP